MKEITYKGEKLREHPGSESGHWYVPDPPALVTQILQKNGRWGPVKVNHARKLGLYPGVTGIISLEAAPGLERWKRQQEVMAALTHPEVPLWMAERPHEEVLALIAKDGAEQAKAAAERGTAIHAAIERAIKGEGVEDEFVPFVKGFYAALQEHDLPSYGWAPERCATHPYGYGCKVDLINEGIVADIKTKDFGPDDNVVSYPNHHEQLWANSHAVGMPDAEKYNIFVSRTHPGLTRVIPCPETDEPWQAFLYKLGLWQVRKKMPVTVRLAA